MQFVLQSFLTGWQVINIHIILPAHTCRTSTHLFHRQSGFNYSAIAFSSVTWIFRHSELNFVLHLQQGFQLLIACDFAIFYDCHQIEAYFSLGIALSTLCDRWDGLV